MNFVIPGLGAVTHDGDWLVTDPRPVPALGKQCRFSIDGFEPQRSSALVACVDAFCSLRTADLLVASDDVFAYYQDVAAEVGDEPGFPGISAAGDVWDFVELGSEPLLQFQDGSWFVVLENECAWEPEHGLMLVLREGRRITKVSEFDGHLTNRHAYGDDSIPEDAVYGSS